MAIPDFQSIMLPFLKFLKDRTEKSNKEIHDELAEFFKLSQDEINQLLPSGTQRIFYNRVAWAKLFLKRALLIDSLKKGYSIITKRGNDALKKISIKSI